MSEPKIISMNLLETVLNSEKGVALRGGNSTHHDALSFVGQLTRFTQDEEEITAIVRASLPENYQGNTLEEVPGMVRDGIAKGYAEPKAKSKADDKQSVRVLQLLDSAGIELFRTPLGDPFATFPKQGGGVVSQPIQSSAFASWVGLQAYNNNKRPLNKTALSEVIDTLIAKALFEAPVREAHVRFAAHEDCIYIDLGGDGGQVVEISNNDWEVVSECPVHFWQPPDFEAMPIPEKGGDLADLQELLGLEDDIFILLVAFLIICLSPTGPYMMLLVQGEQGSGKSYVCELIKRILDPSSIVKMRLPTNEHDLSIQASQARVLVFDNTSGMKADMSDALCGLATGAGFSTRKFYTDNESRTFKHMRPVVLNGIGEFANRPDLLERAILLKLKTMPQWQRRTERQLNKQFKKIFPGILGALFDIASYALRNFEEVEPPTSIRMADAAQWLEAAEPATDFQPGQFIQALEGVQHDMMVDRVVNDPLVIALLKVLEAAVTNEFSGTVGQLHELILGLSDRHNPRLPPTASHLSNTLQRLNPMMRKIGLQVEFGEKSRKGRTIRVRQEEDQRSPNSTEEGSGGTAI